MYLKNENDSNSKLIRLIYLQISKYRTAGDCFQEGWAWDSGLGCERASDAFQLWCVHWASGEEAKYGLGWEVCQDELGLVLDYSFTLLMSTRLVPKFQALRM